MEDVVILSQCDPEYAAMIRRAKVRQDAQERRARQDAVLERLRAQSERTAILARAAQKAVSAPVEPEQAKTVDPFSAVPLDEPETAWR
jgi:hypothetical protein